MNDFLVAAKLADMPPSGKLSIELDDRYLIIVRINDQYFCLDDVCTHDGGSLGDGELEGYCLACPRHGAQFDVRDGRAVTMPATEPTASHAVRLEGDHILVRLAE